jgi:putative nucleotidyltransferase with HDIG domain
MKMKHSQSPSKTDHRDHGSPIASLSDKWFEILIVTVILGGTLLVHSVVDAASVMLHFFYFPVIIAAHYFGRNLAMSTAVFTVLAVTILTLSQPEQHTFGAPTLTVSILLLLAWGGFLGLSALVVGTLADQRASHIKELREAHTGIIEVLAKYLQAADPYTTSHSMRVADLAEKLARKMHLSSAEVENVRVGALLHDIGKVEISTRLIQKAAALSEEEQVEMESHIVRGTELVSSLGTILKSAIPLIEHHHDHYSADSKQEGCHGEDIPIGARVVAVADAYDAIVTDRSYRRGRTPDEAMQILRAAAGTQFDPNVVSAFGQVVTELENEPEAAQYSAAAPAMTAVS